MSASRPDVGDLLQQLLKGVTPGAPGAFWQVLHNAFELVPWWPLIWFTVACAVIGAVLGWWRGRVATGIVLGLVIGPIAWAALWALPPGRYGPARRRLDARVAARGARGRNAMGA
ncbi:MAG TPA: hypothetical protein VF264_03280 [Rhodanobacteraceae bacterium]